MAEITTSQIGNGTTAYGSDIVVKDLDLDVSNRVKDDTPVLNMCMSKKRKVNSTLPLWTDDIYRAPAVQAQVEGAAVNTSQAESNQRFNLGNYTQIFSTVIAASGTARAVMQSGGDPQSYQEVKQLIELMFDVELQLVRQDQIGTKYAGQSGSAAGLPSGQTGRRMGSLNAFAGTMSFNTTSGTVTGLNTSTNNESSDSATTATDTFNIAAQGSQYYTGTFTNQYFSPALYKQLVTVAEQRYNAKIRTVVAPTSLRTSLSDNMPQSRGINRVDSARGDTISTYEGDFNYTYEIYDSWIMDQVSPNSIYFLNEEVVQWGSLRDLGPNNEVFSNADASLDQFIMEGCLIVRNPAGVGVLNNITAGTTAQASLPGARPAALVSRVNQGAGDVTP
jgi:Family of unknown function (DUF5309)